MLHSHLWPLQLCRHKKYYLSNCQIFEKVIEYKICVLILSTTFTPNNFHSKQNWTRYDQNCMLIFVCARYFCPILMKFKFSRDIFRKILAFQISWQSIQWESSCSMRTNAQTNGRREMTKLIVFFFFAILPTRLKISFTLHRTCNFSILKLISA